MFQLSQPLILASNSPRRKQLLQDTGFSFTIKVLPTDETYPEHMACTEIASHISHQKAEMFRGLYPGHLVLTADTVVVIDKKILGKPQNNQEAFEMLSLLSGTGHQVITAVSLLADESIETFSDIAHVSFKKLTEDEINHYISTYKPYDKAGAYGIQEWIGMIGVDRIEGSFYNIMGLPVNLVYNMLKPYFI